MGAQSGAIVSWKISTFVARSAMIDALKRAGIKDPVVRKSRPGTFLRRALVECTARQMIRLIGEDAKRVSYALVDEYTNIDVQQYSATMRTAVTLYKATGEVTFSAQAQVLRDQITSAIKRNEGGLTAHDIGQTLSRILTVECDAISIRDQGGAYFVPMHKLDLLDSIERGLQELCQGGIRFNRFDTILNARTAQDVTNVLVEKLEEDTRRIRDQVHELMRQEELPAEHLLVNRNKKVGRLIARARRFEKSMKLDLDPSIKKMRGCIRFMHTISIQAAKRRAQERVGK